jgi:hypothetical protein
MVPGTTDDPIQDGQGPTNYGATLHVLQNESKSNIVANIGYICSL